MQEITLLFQVIVLLMSVVIHEVSHGTVANLLGDPTARLKGRLTLNPLVHLDFFGSIILPTLMALTPGSPIFGWAKPVPYNPANIRGRFGTALVAFAGPASNLLMATLFVVLIRLGVFSGLMAELAGYIVLINLILGLFNLLPVPPLDGSKVLTPFLPASISYRYERFIESLPFLYTIIVILLFLFVFGEVFFKGVSRLFFLLVGFS
jgi:Zn-dependent protease